MCVSVTCCRSVVSSGYSGCIRKLMHYSTKKLISSSSFHRLDMALAVAEALTPNKPKPTPTNTNKFNLCVIIGINTCWCSKWRHCWIKFVRRVHMLCIICWYLYFVPMCTYMYVCVYCVCMYVCYTNYWPMFVYMLLSYLFTVVTSPHAAITNRCIAHTALLFNLCIHCILGKMLWQYIQFNSAV